MEEVPMLAACLTLFLLLAAGNSSRRSAATVRCATRIQGGQEPMSLQRALNECALTRREYERVRKILMEQPQLATAATAWTHGMPLPAQSLAMDVATQFPTAAAVHPVLAVVLSRPLVSHLHHLAQRVTDGDFESLVIWGELAHRCLAHLLSDPTDPRQWLLGLSQLARDPGQARAIHVCTLVDAIGIPRETVRRKLERLAAQGNVRKVPGGWVICPQAQSPPRDPA